MSKTGADPAILKARGPAEFSSKGGGGGPTIYSGQFVSKINKIFSKKGGGGGGSGPPGHPPRSAPEV